MRLIDLMLFDIAGTVIRDEHLALGVFRRVAEEAGMSVTPGWVNAHMGMHKRFVFQEMLKAHGRPASDADADGLAGRFDEVLLEVFERTPPEPLPTAGPCLEALRGLGVRVGFTTGFSKRTMDFILGSLGWDGEVGVASDEVANGRPAPDLIFEAMRRAGVEDVGRVGTAGDTPNDLHAGTNAGCRLVVGLGHGTHEMDELRPHPHTHLLEDLGPLAGIVAGEGAC